MKHVVEDLQDGIRLCRLAQLMSHDFSILVVGALNSRFSFLDFHMLGFMFFESADLLVAYK